MMVLGDNSCKRDITVSLYASSGILSNNNLCLLCLCAGCLHRSTWGGVFISIVCECVLYTRRDLCQGCW